VLVSNCVEVIKILHKVHSWLHFVAHTFILTLPLTVKYACFIQMVCINPCMRVVIYQFAHLVKVRDTLLGPFRKERFDLPAV
jgi:hypothetical protein